MSAQLEVRIYARTGGFYVVEADQYDSIRRSWLMGQETIEVKTIHGLRLTVSLEDVAAVGEYPRAEDKPT